MQSSTRKVLRSGGRGLSVVGTTIVIGLMLVAGIAFAGDVAPRNSVHTRSIKNGAVTNPKLAANAVTTDKVLDNSLTGSDIDESTLGEVPSATVAGHELSTFKDAGVNAPASSGQFTVLTLSSIPAGNWVIFAKGIAGNAELGSTVRDYTCDLTAGGNSDETAVLGTPLTLVGFSVMAVHSATSSFDAVLTCNNPAGTASAVEIEHTKIVAVPVASLNDTAAP